MANWVYPATEVISGATRVKDADNKIQNAMNDLQDWANSVGAWSGGGAVLNYTTLALMTDTTISAPTTGQILKWNGTGWVNSTPTKDLVGLSNVDNTSDSIKSVLSSEKFSTPRTISISGGVSGSAEFDGSSDIEILTYGSGGSACFGWLNANTLSYNSQTELIMNNPNRIQYGGDVEFDTNGRVKILSDGAYKITISVYATASDINVYPNFSIFKNNIGARLFKATTKPSPSGYAIKLLTESAIVNLISGDIILFYIETLGIYSGITVIGGSQTTNFGYTSMIVERV